MQRVPIESARPIVWFAAIRVAIVAVVLVALALFDFPDREQLIVLTAAVAAPLALGILFLAQSRPTLALSPVIPLLDLAILAVAEAIAPASYAGIHFLALFVVAAHAHLQGEFRGVAIAIAAIILLVPISATSDVPVGG